MATVRVEQTDGERNVGNLWNKRVYTPKMKLIFILFGLLVFVSPSFLKESFMTYIGKYESLKYPVTLSMEEEFYRKKDPNKPFFYVEKKSYELDENGKFRQTETKKIDLEKSLSYYFDCPIKKDDPMYLQTESR